MIQNIKNNPKIAIGAAAGALAVIVIIFFATLSDKPGLPETFAGEIDIKPVYASEYGVGAAQGFVITSAEPLTDELVKAALVLTPSFDYSLKRSDEGRTFVVEPKAPLIADAVYRIGMDPEYALAGIGPRAKNTWAFQTEPGFMLRSSIPTDQGTEVPVNTVLRFTFTQAADTAAAREHISISPEIEGAWESSGAQLTFVPIRNLGLNTVYTVKIDGGLPNKAKDATLSSDIEFQFQTQIRVEDENRKRFWIENDNNCFRTDEIPAFRYYRDWKEKPFASFDIGLFRFPDENSYIEALKSRRAEYYWCYSDADMTFDTSRLTKVSSFEVNNSNGFLLRCPEKLPAGYYLAELEAEGVKRHSLFQVTDLSCYFAAGNKDSLVWVNDLLTGSPVSGAKVSLTGTEISQATDRSGVAVLGGTNERNPILRIESGNDKLVMSGYNYSAGYDKPAINGYDYWYHLSTDRQIYRPGDTINYFGIMAPRSDGIREFSKAELVLSGGMYYGDTAIRREVIIEDGVISGSWELPMLKTDWYSLRIEIEGQSFGHAWFEVAFYEKPAYRFTMKSDKIAVFAGEQIQWDIQAGYFEGTPVAGLEVKVRYDGIDGKVVTSGEGDTSFAYNAPAPEQDRLRSSSYMSVSAVMPELGDVYTYGNVTVFNQDIDIEGSLKRAGRSFELSLDGYDVDLSGINNGAAIWRGEYRKPLTGDIDLSATLIKVEYDKITNGPYYNEYTLQTYYTYEYRRRETIENNFAMTLTPEGLSLTFGLESASRYELFITGKDHKGRAFTRSFYIPEERRGSDAGPAEGDFWEGFDWGSYYRYFFIEELQNSATGYYGRWGSRHAVGEQLKFALWYQGVQVPKPERGNILFFRSQETIRDYVLSEDGIYEMVFEDRDIPNVNLAAVCFDGKYYVESDSRYIMLDPADRAVKVNITTDKNRYAPGETVEMSLAMTDKDGKPLQGSINVSIVDEALFSVAENYVNIGYSVFGNTYYYPYRGTVSHMPVDTGAGGAEMGDGGGEREDFRDTAFFETVATDAKGKADLSFSLPDNITSWRVTWQGYSPGIYVGTGSINIDASLDFFLDYRLARTFLKNDEPKVGLRSAGLGIDAIRSQTAYTVEVPTLAYNAAVSGAANKWQEAALTKLPTGTHKARIGAKNGSFEDAVSIEFSVIESFASHQGEEEAKLTENIKPAGSPVYPTTLMFSDKAYSNALRGLYNLAWRDGIRLEQKLVSRVSADLLATRFGFEGFASGEDEKRSIRHDLIKYQWGNGGISSFTYSQPDVETSALAASAGKEYFDSEALAAYFYRYIENYEGEPGGKTLALWGLAALGKPALVEIQNTLKEPGLSGADKLNLAMALYFAGDGANAKALAEEIISEFTEDLGKEIRSKIDSDDKANQTKATARLALLAAAFGLPEEEGLVRYMENNTYSGDYYLLEKMVIANSRLSRLPEGDAGFTYTLSGKSKTIDLRKEIVYSLRVLPEQLSEIKFSEVKGDITVRSGYLKEGLPPEGDAAKGQLTIERKINGSKREAVTVSQIKPVRITIDFWIAADAPNGCYTITDLLPAGLRFERTESYRFYGRAGGNENKEVEFSIYKTDYERYHYWKPDYYQADGSLRGQIVYIAAPVMTGAFTAQSPRLGHSINDNVLVFAPETRVTIE